MADPAAETSEAISEESTQPETASPDSGAGSKDALLADLAKERDKRQAAEKEAKRLKAIEAELETLRQASMSEQEKAVEKAKAEGRTEATQAMGEKLVAAEIRAVAAGRLTNEQLVTLLDRLNLASFVNDDGEVDEAKVVKFVDGIAPVKTDVPVFPDLGQGVRTPIPTGGGDDPLLRDLKRIAGLT